MGRGARGRRVRSVRGIRRIRQLHGGAFSRFDPLARRQPRRDGGLRSISRPPARRAAAAAANRNRRVTITGGLCAGVLLALLAANGRAETAYVSDDLVLGVYAEQNQQGQRLKTLHSGAVVETLATSGEFTQVQLADGTSGWVKSSFLITHKPATARVKELEDELSRARATTPELAEAAARSELEQLKSQLAATQSELQSARETAAT